MRLSTEFSGSPLTSSITRQGAALTVHVGLAIVLYTLAIPGWLSIATVRASARNRS